MSYLHTLPTYIHSSAQVDEDKLDNIDTHNTLDEIIVENITNFDKIYYIRSESCYYRLNDDKETFSKIFDLSVINSSLNSLFHISDQKHNIADFQTEKDALNAAITEVDSRVTFLATIELAKLWAMKHDKIDINGNLAVKTLGTNDFRVVDFTSFDLSNSIRILPNGISFNDSEDIVLSFDTLNIPSINTEMITVGNIMLNTRITNNEVSTSVIKCKYGEVDILFGENSKSIVNKGYVDNLVSSSISGIQTLVGSRNITIENGTVTLNGAINSIYSVECSLINVSTTLKVGNATSGFIMMANNTISANMVNASAMTTNVVVDPVHVTNKLYVDNAIRDSKIETGDNLVMYNGGKTIALASTIVLSTQSIFNDNNTSIRISSSGIDFSTSNNSVLINNNETNFRLHPRITRDEHVDVLEESQLITKKNLYQSIYRNDAYDSRLLNVNDVQVAVFGINFDTTIENSYKTTYELIATFDKTTTSLFQPNADSVRRPISRPCSIRLATIFGNIIELNLHLIINSQTLPVGMKTDFAYIRLGLLFKQSTGFLQYWSNVGDTYSTIYSELEELQTHSDTYPYIETMQFVTTTNTTTQSVVKIGNGLVFLNSNIAKTDLSSSEYRIHGNDICRLR